MAWSEVSTSSNGWSASTTEGTVLASDLYAGMPSGLLLAITYSVDAIITGHKLWTVTATNTDGWTEV